MKESSKSASKEDMIQWSLEHSPTGTDHAGKRAIRKHFGVSWSKAEEIANLATCRVQRKTPETFDLEDIPSALKGQRKFDPFDPVFRSATINKMRNDPMSMDELADFLGTDPRNSKLMLDSLINAGYNVTEFAGRWKLGKLFVEGTPIPKSFDRLNSPIQKIGLISDTHIGSIKQRLDVLAMAYKKFKEEGITKVYHIGNIIDGYVERINGGEVLFRNISDQIAFLADNYPQESGISTEFITGECHEGWCGKDSGINIGRYIESELNFAGRKDLTYIGHIERDILLKRGNKSCVMRLAHPGGGSSYATSYKIQKLVESFQGGEKPAIYIVGHFHKIGLFYPRGVVAILVPSCQDQTIFMRKHSISSEVGFSILEIGQDLNGAPSQFNVRFFPFYDRKYHLEIGDTFESRVFEEMQKVI